LKVKLLVFHEGRGAGKTDPSEGRGFPVGLWLGNVWIRRCQTFIVFPIFLAFEG